jgi:hypothetical protein
MVKNVTYQESWLYPGDLYWLPDWGSTCRLLCHRKSRGEQQRYLSIKPVTWRLHELLRKETYRYLSQAPKSCKKEMHDDQHLINMSTKSNQSLTLDIPARGDKLKSVRVTGSTSDVEPWEYRSWFYL